MTDTGMLGYDIPVYHDAPDPEYTTQEFQEIQIVAHTPSTKPPSIFDRMLARFGLYTSSVQDPEFYKHVSSALTQNQLFPH